MALTLSVGFVVDDAIVMLENIIRHMEMGKAPMQAAVDGSREISFTILAMTVSLAAVFIPVMFMSGIIGRLFHEFAVTIMVAILISGFVSISLTPMLCSRFLKPPSEERHNALYRASEKALDAMRDAYAWMLRGVMRHRPITMLVALGTLVATGYLLVITPKGFIPPQDTGLLNGTIEAGQPVYANGFLPSLHQPSVFRAGPKPVLNLELPAGVSLAQRRKTLSLIRELDQARMAPGDEELSARLNTYDLAFKMQT